MTISEPAVVLVLRGVNAFSRMETFICKQPTTAYTSASVTASNSRPAPLDRIMSPTPQLAYLQASLFFREHELYADDASRPLLSYLPPPLNTRDTHEQK